MSLTGCRPSTSKITCGRVCAAVDLHVKPPGLDSGYRVQQLFKLAPKPYRGLTPVKHRPRWRQSRLLHNPLPARNISDALARCKASFDLPEATHAVERLTINDIGKEVVLYGYLGSRADLSANISFVPLLSRDLTTSVQIISVANSTANANTNHHAKIKSVAANSPVAVRGTIQPKRPAKQQSAARAVHRHEEIELSVTGIETFNEFPSNVTFEQDTVIAPEQRHLQLRHSQDLRHALRFRARVADYCRAFLNRGDAGFVELETPLLFKPTPEGAREFLVPTRRNGLVYALPQSPQQYKQILMASGFPGYYQFARCFRDEDLRADRQPEFTQLDLEMAFAGSDHVMTCVEDLIRGLWQDTLSENLPVDRFPRMSYQEAMARYGSDKPDPRLGMEIMRIDHMIPVDLVSKIGPLSDPIVEAFKLDLAEDPQSSRLFIDGFMSSPEARPFTDNPNGQPGIFVYDSRRPLGGLQPFGFEAAEQLEEQLQLEEGNVVVIQARPKEPFTGGSTRLGTLRQTLHTAAVAGGLLPKPEGWNFVWINGFPLFTPLTSEYPGHGGSSGLACTHHPFTAPASTHDIDLLATAPLEARGDHFDLVLNGVELGGGSRRIHSAELQEYVFRQVLGMDDDAVKSFSHLLDVLQSGCPPHAGFALGLDRLCAEMLGKDSIRDVIAFPKSGRGDDLLVKSPGKVTQEQLDTYHLRLK